MTKKKGVCESSIWAPTWGTACKPGTGCSEFPSLDGVLNLSSCYVTGGCLYSLAGQTLRT